MIATTVEGADLARLLLDLLIDPFDATWPHVRDLAVAGEERGWAGVWTWDHLSGTTHQQHHVLEEVGDLVDVVGGQDHGAGMLREVGEQAVEEEAAGHGVETEVGLVEERERGA